jgi:hypothetical protein
MRGAIKLITSLAAVAAFGQQPPAYRLRAVLRPGMTIGGHTFDRDTAITAAVINDAGEVAFVARWNDHSSVFTLKRLVSNGQGFIEGVALLGIPVNAHIAISPSGVVAYQAFYDVSDIPGIFVERRPAIYSDPTDLNLGDFTVNDDGHASKRHGLPFSGNKRGQIVIPVNTPEGPYLFIGTPK